MNNLEYKNFKKKRTVKDILYVLENIKKQLQVLQEEFHFLQFLVTADIFKDNIMNLFEDLEHFKKAIKKHLDKSNQTLDMINKHVQELANVREENHQNKELLTEQEEIEKHVFAFIKQAITLKLNIYNFLPAVIKNK